MTGSIAHRRCDHSACPAPAQRQAIVYGQDFYFCSHHAAELDGLLVTLPTQAQSAADHSEPTGAAAAGTPAAVGASQRRWR